ncbi:hypothetical protein CPC16_008680 [Podila verticillata]|nr:hypothetical protein BGZ52_008603 [Haplosporangium bisporale]KAF9395320.1 hypothetical protein CPC16_008680 [Podila verticillata]KFH69749.1 hypothetical protein MVEG_04555 [Podila verticillata NRRL 6337]
MRLSDERTMFHRIHPSSPSSTLTTTTSSSSPRIFRKSMWSVLSLLVLTLSLTTNTDAALQAGFCGDCQTFSNAIGVCGGTFTKTDIEIQGTYNLPQAQAKCVCTSTMQSVLWTCHRCEGYAGFNVSTPPPNLYRSTCMKWGVTAADYEAPYTGVIAPDTQGIPNVTVPPGGSNPATGGGTSPTGGNGVTSTSGSLGPSPSSDDSKTTAGGSGGGDGVNPTAIGISVGLIGIAAVGGVAAVFMMRRKRHARHAPLELGDSYVGLEDQWEKPRPSSPPMAPAPVASGAPLASRGPMQGRPSPFETRPGGGGSVVAGYDGQYDQYDHYQQGSQVGGYNDGYNQGGQYDQNYYQGHGQQGFGPPAYPPQHDYGYDQHSVPTSGPGYTPAKGDGGHYM